MWYHRESVEVPWKRITISASRSQNLCRSLDLTKPRIAVATWSENPMAGPPSHTHRPSFRQRFGLGNRGGNGGTASWDTITCNASHSTVCAPESVSNAAGNAACISSHAPACHVHLNLHGFETSSGSRNIESTRLCSLLPAIKGLSGPFWAHHRFNPDIPAALSATRRLSNLRRAACARNSARAVASGSVSATFSLMAALACRPGADNGSHTFPASLRARM